MESIVWALHSKMPGEIWEEDEIKVVVDQIHSYGFTAEVVESVNVTTTSRSVCPAATS